jgi:hypothetical protein
VLDIVIRFRDDTLLRALRDKLTGDKRPIAVRVLSQAALDPRSGSHVRESLYDWARTTKSQAVIDLVAEVCGSTFGEQKPGMALVRLGWVAQNSQPGSPALATALASIASRHPEEVTTSLTKWFADYDPPTAGINAFLAVAGTKQGAVLLCGRTDPASDDSGFRDALISYFQRSLAEPASYEAAISVLKIWEELSAEGTLGSRIVINLLGRAIEPEFGNKTIERLHPGTWDTESFWGKAFKVALSGKDIGPKVDVSRNADEPMVSVVIRDEDIDEDAGAGEPTYAPAIPATSTGEETDASAQAG